MWWLRRLRAMSVAEVADRSWRLLRRPRLAPVPVALASWRGPAAFYVPRAFAASVPMSETPSVPWDDDGTDPRTTWERNRGHAWVLEARTRRPDLAAWRRANPLGVGINWASAMEAAIRIHSLAWVAGLAGGNGELATMIFEHAEFVAAHLSRFSSANNHLIVELTGLIVADRVLGLDRWRARALSELATELERQVFADGVDAEMATHYHAFVLEALLLVAWLERAYGAPQRWLERVIAKMAGYLEALRVDDGTLLQQGDSDDGKLLPWFARDHAGQLIAAAAALVAPGERVATPPVDREGTFWVTGGHVPPVASPQRSRAFLPSGQIALRSPRLTATFDAGPFGFGSLAAHAHCDALAINVALDGHRFLVDRGTYRYHGDVEARDRYRMTAAHNTLQVEAREQAQAGGPFLWTRVPTVTLERCQLGEHEEVVTASHDGFAPVVHRRTLVHRDDMLMLVDEVSREATVEIRFHLAPGLVAVVGPDLTRAGPGWIYAALSAEVTKHSDAYREEIDATTLVRTATGTRWITVIGAGQPDLARIARLIERGRADAE